MSKKVFQRDKIFECATEFKSLPDSDGQRRVEGYASIFGNVDSYGDVVDKGAFKKTIQERIPKGLVPFAADHSWEGHKLLGTIEKASEDDNGLLFEASISKAPSADDYYIKMVEGHLHQCSFSFRTIAENFPKAEGAEVIDGKVVYRHLTELMLLDIAPVVLAANERASITHVKAFNELLQIVNLSDLSKEDLQQAAAQFMKMAEKFEEKTIIEPAEPVNPLTAEMIKIESQAIAIELEILKHNMEC